jgi:hypothetical protein
MKVRILFGAAMMVASSGALATGLVGATGIASASQSGPPAYTCTGGDLASQTFTSIPSGTYSSITVAGVCNVAPGAAINVVGNFNVDPGAFFDGQSVTSTITVGHNVTAGAGALLGLGCQPTNAIGMFAGVPCMDNPAGQTVITVDGNVTTTNADTVLLRGLTVGGNVTLTGGGGDIPWSIKGDTIGGNLTISEVTADWLGVQFNHIGNNATLTDITATDPGDPGRTVAVVENTVLHNLNCTGLAPGVSPGFIPGETNHVGHNATGQCASISVPLS